MKLAVYLAKEVAAILRAVLTKKLYNDSTVHLLCSNYWVQPIYQELLHSSSRYNATREGERKRPSSGLARVAAYPKPPKQRKPSASGTSFSDWIGGTCYAATLQVWFPAHWAPVVLQQLQQKEDSYRAENPSWMDQEVAHPGHDVVLLILGAASLTWTFLGGHAVHCGADGAASSSSNFTALNAAEMVMAARTKQWRVQHFMENDDDFAYAFASYDQALLAGGHGLATEWLEVRARQEEHLVPAAAAVVAALRPGAPSRVHQHAPKPTAKPFARSRRQGVRLHENPGNSSQAVTHRVGVLANVFRRKESSLPGLRLAKILALWDSHPSRTSSILNGVASCNGKIP